ncbi:MAG: 5'/3'-nucleotidase SurE [Bacilli bacterium]|nr:5'/3'-nucleotidase SurE [Bacilli bacterium]
MKILITNDDGYNSQGIRILREKMQKYGEVFLVAPHHHMSGASVSRIFWNEARVHEHGDHIYSVEGTPADAVSFALHGLNLDPDIIVSGINNGFNVGADTVYSGTVGACMEALKFQKKAIAFSADFNHFEPASRDFDQVMDFILAHDLLSDKYLLNVNFLSRQNDKSKGIIITDLGFRPAEHYYLRGDNGTYKNRRKFLPFDFSKGTDLWAVELGYISITPLKFANQTEIGLAECKRKVGQLE